MDNQGFVVYEGINGKMLNNLQETDFLYKYLN